MEKRQYKDYYLPWAKPRLFEQQELFKEISEPAGDFQDPDTTQGLYRRLILKIQEVIENMSGQSLVYGDIKIGRSVPPKWSRIIDYLKASDLVSDFYFEQSYFDEPSLFKARISSPRNPEIFKTDGNKLKLIGFAYGQSKELDEAIIKAIGEFLERFPLMVYRERNLLRASGAELAGRRQNFLDIKDIAGFSEEQKSLNAKLRFDEKSDFLWVPGKSLISNKNILVPAQLVFWNYNFNHKGWQEPRLRECNTNGAGGHVTLTKAILSGLYELIQRDGFFIYWLNRQAPPRISFEESGFAPLDELLAECRRFNFEVLFFDTRTETGVPSCFCCLVNKSGAGAKISFGGGCGADWRRALYRSLEEALSIFYWIRRKLENNDTKKIPEIGKNYVPFQDNSIGQAERSLLWADEKMFKDFEFFFKGQVRSLAEIEKGQMNFSSPEEELRHLVEIFKDLGEEYNVIYYQARHKILDDLGSFSVKVIVPPLVQLYLYEPSAPLGAKRLKEVPQKLGFAAAKNWNPWPHPFP